MPDSVIPNSVVPDSTLACYAQFHCARFPQAITMPALDRSSLTGDLTRPSLGCMMQEGNGVGDSLQMGLLISRLLGFEF